MRKNRFIKVLVFLFAIALLSSGMVVQTKAMSPEKQIKSNTVVKQDSKEKAAQEAVDSLYTDTTYDKIRDDLTHDDIAKAAALVDELDASRLKTQLEYLIGRAEYLLHERNAYILVYALYQDSEHTVIRDDLTQAEIDYASDFVEQLGWGIARYELRILIKEAQKQLDERNPQLVVQPAF